MKRIALLAQNEHEASSALSIARRIAAEGWAESELVSLDSFWRQGAQRTFEGSGIAVRAVEPRRPLRAPFYRLPAAGRLAAVLANQSTLARVADRYDALIAGCDGALERVLINAMRKRRRPAYLVISSLNFSFPEARLKTALRRLLARLRLNHLFPSEIGQGMCDRIFAPGEHSRRQLLELGVPGERIEVTGAPRFAPLLESHPDREREIGRRLGAAGPLRLLYLAGAWEWHGLDGLGRRELAQLGSCAEAAGRRADRLHLSARLHPRSSAAERRRLESIPGLRVLTAERPLRDDLEGSDVVLAAASTGLLEALAMGRLVLLVDLAGMGEKVHLRDFEGAGMWTVREPEALRRAFQEMLEPGPELARRIREEVASLSHFLAPETPRASQRIADRIRSDLRA